MPIVCLHPSCKQHSHMWLRSLHFAWIKPIRATMRFINSANTVPPYGLHTHMRPKVVCIYMCRYAAQPHICKYIYCESRLHVVSTDRGDVFEPRVRFQTNLLWAEPSTQMRPRFSSTLHRVATAQNPRSTVNSSWTRPKSKILGALLIIHISDDATSHSRLGLFRARSPSFWITRGASSQLPGPFFSHPKQLHNFSTTGPTRLLSFCGVWKEMGSQVRQIHVLFITYTQCAFVSVGCVLCSVPFMSSHLNNKNKYTI